MIETAMASYDGPSRMHTVYFEDSDAEDMATSRQKQRLIEYFYQHIQDDEQREGYISQLGDLTEKEARDWVSEFECGMWR